MRFGKWRGASLAFAVAAVFGLGLASTVRADGWHIHPTLPGEVPAYDYTTGGEYFAPPVPYGHYAKDYVGGATVMVGVAARAVAWATVTAVGTAATGPTAAKAAAFVPAAGSFTTVMAVAISDTDRSGAGIATVWPAATTTGTRRTSLLATRRP